MALAAGASHLMVRGRAARIACYGVVVLLVSFNLWSCHTLRVRSIVKWSGEEVEDRALITELEKRNITVVSCRFMPLGYWYAYRLSYIAGEKIILAPYGKPGGSFIRSD